MSKFGTTKVTQVGRTQNRHADSLATLASSMTEELPRSIKVELIAEPSINITDGVVVDGVEVAVVVTAEPGWMDPIIEFLAMDRLLDDEKEANKVHQVAPHY